MRGGGISVFVTVDGASVGGRRMWKKTVVEVVREGEWALLKKQRCGVFRWWVPRKILREEPPVKAR